MTFTDLIKTWKGDKSQAVAADELGIAQNTLSGWLDGRSLPTSPRIRHLAVIFSVEADLLRNLIQEARNKRVGIRIDTVEQAKAWVDHHAAQPSQAERA
jgi:transcriptional regulator with XRE-family HTH domain